MLYDDEFYPGWEDVNFALKADAMPCAALLPLLCDDLARVMFGVGSHTRGLNNWVNGSRLLGLVLCRFSPLGVLE